MIKKENLIVVTLTIAIVALGIAFAGIFYTKTSFSNLASVVSALRGQASLTQGNILTPPLTIYYDSKTKGRATALMGHYKRMYGKEADIQLSDISAGDWDTNGRNDLILNGENPIDQCCASSDPANKSCITTRGGKELCYTTPKCVTDMTTSKEKIPLLNYTIPCKDTSGGGYSMFSLIGSPGDGAVYMLTEPNPPILSFLTGGGAAPTNDTYALAASMGMSFSEHYILYSTISAGGGWSYSTNLIGRDATGSFKELSPCEIASRMCGLASTPPECSVSSVCAADGSCNKKCEDYCYCDPDCENYSMCQPHHKCEGLEKACWNFTTHTSNR